MIESILTLHPFVVGHLAQKPIGPGFKISAGNG